jgi:hypothetical protein
MKKVKLSLDGFKELIAYVKRCFETELIIESKMLMRLIEFHLQEIWEKLHRKSLDVQYKNKTKIVISFTEGEILCFSYLFAKIPSAGYMLAIEGKLIDGLTI